MQSIVDECDEIKSLIKANGEIGLDLAAALFRVAIHERKRSFLHERLPVFQEQIREAELQGEESPILITQNLFRADDRHLTDGRRLTGVQHKLDSRGMRFLVNPRTGHDLGPSKALVLELA